jgi:hypothetical protein
MHDKSLDEKMMSVELITDPAQALIPVMSTALAFTLHKTVQCIPCFMISPAQSVQALMVSKCTDFQQREIRASVGWAKRDQVW